MNTLTFKDYDLKLELVPFTNIIGGIASGKTFLLKTLINQSDSSTVFIDDKNINEYDIDYLRKNITAVLNNFIFNTTYVKSELEYYQRCLKYDDKLINNNIKKFVTFFNLDNILNKEIGEISRSEKAFIKILSLLIINPRVIGIDDMLTYLSNKDKLKIVKYSKENNISILNVTSNSEELLFGTKIVVLDNFHAVLYDDTLNVLSNDKTLSKIGMNMPFIAELSNNLNYYDLLKEKYFDINSLVGELWK